jgi:type II secretory pathway component PulK
MPRRRGIVLLAVLLVVVVLSLAAYQYSEWMTAEDQAAVAYARMAQAKALAESGVNYAAVLLSNQSAMSGTLNGNPWDNPQAFQNIPVPTAGNGPQGAFSIVGLVSPDDPNQMSQAYRCGVIDEAGKINVNALLALDGGKGDLGFQILMQLPNMTEDVANSILDWLDPDDTPRTDGAEEDYYDTLSPPYHCKNGPLDSLEELLLVKGVTPQLLYGNDLNRNGVLDPDEDGGAGQVDLGWSAYLTVYSREPNTDVNGNARVYLNDSDLNFLSDQLTTTLGQDLANYIIAYRLYGPAASNNGTPTGQRAATRTPAFTPLSDNDADDVKTTLQTARTSSSSQKPKTVGSHWDLVDSSVNIPVGSGRNARTVTLQSPLKDPGQQRQLLPLLLDQTTTTQNTDLTPRVNINTASQTVLHAVAAVLQNASQDSAAQSTAPPNALDDTDIQTILSTRPDPSSNDAPDPIFQTPTWLLTEANLSLDKVKALAPYITARTQVYRFQSIGYFQGGSGPVARIEAVVDANNGRPRIVYHRDLAALGTGFDLSQMMGR